LAKTALEKKVESIEGEFKESLNYAQRIQRTLLPTVEEIQALFPKSYQADVLFQPKDVVSGDFYWGTKVHNRTIFFVGDATGHGVSGSFITILATNILENLAKEKMVILPDLLLEELHKQLQIKLRQTDESSERSVLDSLEGYAVLIEEDKVTIASAMRPIIVVGENGLQNIAGTRKTIGGKQFMGDEYFTSHTITLNSGEAIYLYSDGIESQIGGYDGQQKFGKSQVIELISQAHELPFSKRSRGIFKKIQDWKGFFAEQSDDIVFAVIEKQ
ncbi:MAG: serine/threonine-protein phosphatase, partial [Bacteroidia bacterium]|nr:serine/threonine-protein phosphatase [Bacteroidia bacterium]